MKQFIFIFLFIMIGSCRDNESTTPILNEQPVTKIEEISSDSLYNVLVELKESYSSVITENIEYKIEIKKKTDLIDTLLKKTVKYQNKYIELKIISDEIQKISSLNSELINQVTKENNILKLRDDSIVGILIKEQNYKNIILYENKKLKTVISNANKLIPTGLVVTPYSITKSFFTSKEKKSITYQANKVKSIVVSFSLPYSTICTKGVYTFNVEVYGAPEIRTLFKTVTIEYDGNEVPINVVFDDPNIIYKQGIHSVIVKSKLDVLAKTSLDLK